MSDLQEIMTERLSTGQLNEVIFNQMVFRRNPYIQFNYPGDLKIVNLLITNGMAIDIEDKNGNNAMDLAKKYGIFEWNTLSETSQN